MSPSLRLSLRGRGLSPIGRAPRDNRNVHTATVHGTHPEKQPTRAAGGPPSNQPTERDLT